MLTGTRMLTGTCQVQTGLLGQAGAEKWWSAGWCPRHGSVTSWELIPSSPQFRPGTSSKNECGLSTSWQNWNKTQSLGCQGPLGKQIPL